MERPAVSAHGIQKSYGKNRALSGVDLEVKQGEIFGLIGADGSGKTSMFRILTTLILADGGSATVDGLDVVRDYRAIRDRIGYMPGRFSLYQDLTVLENLTFFATVFHTTIEKNYALVRDIWQQIEPFSDRRAGALSGGMKQKLALCCALIHRPSVLFLDEPTTGVDPVSRRELWDMLGRLRESGISILVSTPYMDEAARCSRIALISGGSILETGTPAGIAAAFNGELWAISADHLSALLPILRTHPEAKTCFSFGDAIHLSAARGAIDPEKLAVWIAAQGHGAVSIARIEPSIEDRFLTLPAAGGAA